jgi:formylglycine-generating enzyme required for sulfatase activity
MPWLLVGIVASACGRIGFDPLVNGGGGDDVMLGDGGPMVSCADLGSMCGPSGTSPCCESTIVAGGMFYRSFDVGTDNRYFDMTNPATLSDFRLDTYEITVGRFRQFVDAGMGTQASPPATGAGARMLNGLANEGGWDSSWTASLPADTAALVAAIKCMQPTYQTWTDAAGANEALPMNCITWFEAFAFCAWDGGFLPTEAEWNYAAAGGNEQRAYPWSTPASSLTLDCSYANYCLAINRVGSESPKGDGMWGHADLAGNLWEWTLDWHQGPFRLPSCADCADLTPGLYRALKGGYFGSFDTNLRGAERHRLAPETRSVGNGARCARATGS